MAIVRLTYKLNDGHNYIDIARGLSLTERRLIHQKQVFTILGGMVIDDANDTKLKLSTAPNNFYTRNAVTRGFRAWKASRAKALEAAGDSAKDIVAKYSDYKVFLDSEITQAKYLNPVDAGSNAINSGEWSYSQIVPEQGAGKIMHIVGNTHTSSKYCLALGWLETRKKLLRDPDMPDYNSDGIDDVEVDFISTMFQDSVEDTERIDRIGIENDDHPFDRDVLMTTQSAFASTEPNNLQLQFMHHSSVNEVQASVPGFQALCGLIRADVTGGSNPILIIDVETKGWNF